MTRLDKLWRAVEGPGAPPRLDSGRVKARVTCLKEAIPFILVTRHHHVH